MSGGGRSVRGAEASARAKRALDVLLVVLAAPLVVPAAVVVAVLVRRRLGSPVLFVQERSGRNARTFRLLKFRTMLPPAPGRTSDEDRLTPFGRLLRATSLDELPSLLNVLRGEMSLVGPRPLPVAYTARYGQRYVRRLDVLPGVTGWAQVKGRNALGWRERFELDLWYVEHRSLLLDVRILLLTIGKVLRREDVTSADHATMTEFTGFDPLG